MPALAIRQCPRCVLRFGTSSELDQHLRLDHRSARRRESPASVPEVHDDSGRSMTTERPARPRRSVLGVVVVAALVAFLAVVSWHVAALVSAGLAVALAVHASLGRTGRAIRDRS